MRRIGVKPGLNDEISTTIKGQAALRIACSVHHKISSLRRILANKNCAGFTYG